MPYIILRYGLLGKVLLRGVGTQKWSEPRCRPLSSQEIRSQPKSSNVSSDGIRVCQAFQQEVSIILGVTSTVPFLVEYHVPKQRFNTVGEWLRVA